VNNLDNCQEQQQGKKLLELVEKLAKNIRSSQITLVDASKIKLSDGSVSLKTLYNLTTGQSWYNSLGYICLDNTYGTYETLYEENLRKIQTVSVSNFIEDVKDQMGDKLVEQLIDNTFTEINEIFKDILTPAMTIQTYFTKVKDILKENTSPNIHLLIGLLSYIDVANIITTSISDCLLVKLLNPAGGKRGEIIPRNKRKTRRTGRKQDRRHKKYSNRRSQKTL